MQIAETTNLSNVKPPNGRFHAIYKWGKNEKYFLNGLQLLCLVLSRKIDRVYWRLNYMDVWPTFSSYTLTLLLICSFL